MEDAPSSPSILKQILNKFEERPFLYTGVGALSGIVGFGLYGLRNRNMRLSLYLINLRLAAQGSFVGILTIGVTYTLLQHYTKKKEPPSIGSVAK